MPVERILALDLGKKSASAWRSATSWVLPRRASTRIEREGRRDDIETLRRLAVAQRRYALSDRRSPAHERRGRRQGDYTREFAGELERKTGLPIEFCDERWTSREAERTLRGAGVANDARKPTIDRLSAVILLQSYLDSAHPECDALEASAAALCGAAGGGRRAGCRIRLYRLNAALSAAFPHPVFVEFPHGTSTGQMAATLAQSGVLREPLAVSRGAGAAARHGFAGRRISIRQTRVSRSTSTGASRAAISTTWSCWCRKATTCSISRRPWRSSAPCSRRRFWRRREDPAPIRDLDPQAQTLEGYLFPNKYRVYRHTTAQQICRHDDR